MRPRYVINKGIRKVIKAISSLFEVGGFYTAVIYNPKDLSKKITAYSNCEEDENGKKLLVFTFTAADTATLKIGFATIEIYDSNHTLMVYKDNFAIIRDNSFRIDDSYEPDTES